MMKTLRLSFVVKSSLSTRGVSTSLVGFSSYIVPRSDVQTVGWSDLVYLSSFTILSASPNLSRGGGGVGKLLKNHKLGGHNKLNFMPILWNKLNR